MVLYVGKVLFEVNCVWCVGQVLLIVFCVVVFIVLVDFVVVGNWVSGGVSLFNMGFVVYGWFLGN